MTMFICYTGSCSSDPPAVDHSTVAVSDDGNTATYTCITGYELKDNTQSTSTCSGDPAAWTSVSDLCQIKSKLRVLAYTQIFMYSDIF